MLEREGGDKPESESAADDLWADSGSSGGP